SGWLIRKHCWWPARDGDRSMCRAVARGWWRGTVGCLRADHGGQRRWPLRRRESELGVQRGQVAVDMLVGRPHCLTQLERAGKSLPFVEGERAVDDICGEGGQLRRELAHVAHLLGHHLEQELVQRVGRVDGAPRERREHRGADGEEIRTCIQVVPPSARLLG